MTSEQAVYRRVLRRETHAPRTTPAVVVASVLVLALAAAAVVGVWWLVAPGSRGTIEETAGSLTAFRDDSTILTVVGAAAVVVAVVLLALALLPGRRARRGRRADRLALLVDDGVLADAVADAVALRCGIDRGQVSATVGRRAAVVRVTPTSGLPLDPAAAADSATAALAAVGFSLPARVRVAERGVVA